jgi:transposase-like protein
MTDRAEEVSTTGLADTKQQPVPTKRRQYSEALKRQIVAETLEPGSSVSIVARRHDVNSNQLFDQSPETAERAPGVLARPANSTAPPDYWLEAGRPAAAHSANVEAITYLTRGIVPRGSAGRRGCARSQFQSSSGRRWATCFRTP